MDLDRILRRSRHFFRQHHLPDWADAIPERPFWPTHRDETIARALSLGFDRGFAFPPFSRQRTDFQLLVEETARKHAPGVPDNQQYQVEPFLADTWTKIPNGKILQRDQDLGPRTDGPYVLLFTANPVSSAWGKTGRQIVEFFQAKGWQGLTVPEYFVLQRYFCEKHQDHRFFDEPQDNSLSHYLWLLDSMVENEISVAYGSVRGINVQACPAGNRDARRAALAGIILEMR